MPDCSRKSRPSACLSIAIVAQLPAAIASGASTLTERQCDTGMPLRIEDVAIALSIEVEIALVIAAGGQRALADRNAGDAALRVARVLDADDPRFAIGLRSDEAHVAAQVYVAVPHAEFRQQRGGAVGRVFLAEA